MKALTTLLVFTLFLGGTAWFGYTQLYPRLLATVSTAVGPRFPVERTLTDQSGRTVSAQLLARSETEVQFIRISDGAPYQYPLRMLSAADQQFIRLYPATQLAPLSQVAGRTSGPRWTLQAETQLTRERAELQHRISLLELELQKRNSKSPSLSADQIEQRIDDFRNRIIDIEKELLEIRHRGSR